MTAGISNISRVSLQATDSPRNSQRGRLGVRRKNNSVQNSGLQSVCGQDKVREGRAGAALTSDWE